MNIGGMKDWLTFVDKVAERAKRTLEEAGIPEIDWDILGLFGSEPAHHSEYALGIGDDDGTRAAIGALVVCREIHRHAQDAKENASDLAIASIAALSWKLHMLAGGLYEEELEPFLVRSRNKSVAAKPRKRESLQSRAMICLIEEFQGITKSKLLEMLGHDESITFDPSNLNLELEEGRLRIDDLQTQKYRFVELRNIDAALSRARKKANT